MLKLYSIIRPGNKEVHAFTDHSIGEMLERELEKRGYITELPTAADWGYVFRTKVKNQSFDISVVNLPNGEFGIAIETPKKYFGIDFFKTNSLTLNEVNQNLMEIMLSKMNIPTLNWYSEKEWRTKFGQDYWEYTRN